MSALDRIIINATQGAINVIEAHERRQERKAKERAAREEIATSVRLTISRIQKPERSSAIVVREHEVNSLAFRLQALASATRPFWNRVRSAFRLFYKWTEPVPWTCINTTIEDAARQGAQIRALNEAPEKPMPESDNVRMIKARLEMALRTSSVQESSVEDAIPSLEYTREFVEPQVDQVAKPLDQSTPETDSNMKMPSMIQLDDKAADTLGLSNLLGTPKKKKRRRKNKGANANTAADNNNNNHSQETSNVSNQHLAKPRRISLQAEPNQAASAEASANIEKSSSLKIEDGISDQNRFIPSNLPKFKHIDAPVRGAESDEKSESKPEAESLEIQAGENSPMTNREVKYEEPQLVTLDQEDQVEATEPASSAEATQDVAEDKAEEKTAADVSESVQSQAVPATEVEIKEDATDEPTEYTTHHAAPEKFDIQEEIQKPASVTVETPAQIEQPVQPKQEKSDAAIKPEQAQAEQNRGQVFVKKKVSF